MILSTTSPARSDRLPCNLNQGSKNWNFAGVIVFVLLQNSFRISVIVDLIFRLSNFSITPLKQSGKEFEF